MKRFLALGVACGLAVAHSAEAGQGPSGEALYKTRCAACHDNADGRTPSRQTLQNLTPSRIMRTLDFGAMMTIAYILNREEREAIARNAYRRTISEHTYEKRFNEIFSTVLGRNPKS